MSETPANNLATRSFCTFRAEGRLFAIELASLREISTNTQITPVPPAPPAVRGLANLRSRIHLVLDLRPLLGLPPTTCTADSRLIIFKPSVAEDTGLLVDGGGDILAVRQDQIEPAQLPPAASEPERATLPLVSEVCKLENELMMIIDATRITDAVSRLTR